MTNAYIELLEILDKVNKKIDDIKITDEILKLKELENEKE